MTLHWLRRAWHNFSTDEDAIVAAVLRVRADTHGGLFMGEVIPIPTIGKQVRIVSGYCGAVVPQVEPLDT